MMVRSCHCSECLCMLLTCPSALLLSYSHFLLGFLYFSCLPLLQISRQDCLAVRLSICLSNFYVYLSVSLAASFPVCQSLCLVVCLVSIFEDFSAVTSSLCFSAWASTLNVGLINKGWYGVFFACGFWCLDDVSSVSPSSCHISVLRSVCVFNCLTICLSIRLSDPSVSQSKFSVVLSLSACILVFSSLLYFSFCKQLNHAMCEISDPHTIGIIHSVRPGHWLSLLCVVWKWSQHWGA